MESHTLWQWIVMPSAWSLLQRVCVAVLVSAAVCVLTGGIVPWVSNLMAWIAYLLAVTALLMRSARRLAGPNGS